MEINISGSIQNPAFSPDGKTFVFTHFRNGYNKPPSDLYTYNLETKELKPLVVDGNSNVNLPGECWNNLINSIIFSSERDPHDEIYYITETGTTGDEILENKKAKWIGNAFVSLESSNYPKVKAISWWHENFDNSLLKVNSSAESLDAYTEGVSSSTFITIANINSNKLIEPSSGIYHSAYPDFGGTEVIVTSERITDFETLVEKNIVWAYFSNNGYENIQFPATEVNGNWFPWNGQYNGAGETTGYGDPNLFDGAERFRDAYRHIIDICNANGANNITRFFHIDAYSEPNTDWNKMGNYYPGDNYIDWLGVSIYGLQESNEDYQEFSEIMNNIYPTLSNLSNKPIAILEFAITELE